MNTQETIITAIQTTDVDNMLVAYRLFSEQSSATVDDLFELLSLPSIRREEFLSACCSYEILVHNKIVSPNYRTK